MALRSFAAVAFCDNWMPREEGCCAQFSLLEIFLKWGRDGILWKTVDSQEEAYP